LKLEAAGTPVQLAKGILMNTTNPPTGAPWEPVHNTIVGRIYSHYQQMVRAMKILKPILRRLAGGGNLSRHDRAKKVSPFPAG
jgi:hypothetical protein